MGFWVAITMNGSGSGWATPSEVTWRSSIDSSSAACVLGGVRLISSASSTLVTTGPGRNRTRFSSGPPPSRMSWPVTSDGIRSGVNWTRLTSRSSAAASALTISVLATPGTPSSSTWPRASSAATRPDRVPSWPTTSFATSSRTARMAVRGSRPSGASVGSSYMGEDLLTDAVDGARQGHELAVVEHGLGPQRPPQHGLVHPCALGGHGRQHAQLRVAGHAEAIAQERPEVAPQQLAGVLGRPAAVEQAARRRHQLGPGHGDRLGLEHGTAE